jgi:hypothetical protein
MGAVKPVKKKILLISFNLMAGSSKEQINGATDDVSCYSPVLLFLKCSHQRLVSFLLEHDVK